MNYFEKDIFSNQKFKNSVKKMVSKPLVKTMDLQHLSSTRTRTDSLVSREYIGPEKLNMSRKALNNNDF